MSIAENYRSTKEYREILRILQNSGSHKDNFLWQNFDTLRQITSIKNLEIDFVAREVTAFLDPAVTVLDSSRSFFIKLDYKGSIFKVDSYKIEKNLVRFSFPKLIKTLELRGYKRYCLDPKNENLVCLKVSRTETKELSTEFFIRVLDISYNGLGLLISDLNHSFLNQHKSVLITQIGSNKLSQPIKGEVLYLSDDFDSSYCKRKYRQKKFGLKLFSYIPETIFESLIQ